MAWPIKLTALDPDPRPAISPWRAGKIAPYGAVRTAFPAVGSAVELTGVLRYTGPSHWGGPNRGLLRRAGPASTFSTN